MDSRSDLNQEYEAAQAALLSRYAPDTVVHRIRWSQGETNVLELGSGPPLVYLHGGLSAAFEWVPVFSNLARTHRVIAVDRPGHGLADPFDYTGVNLFEHAPRFVRDILDALELPSVNLVGNSLGGLYSVLFAIANPGRVSRLVLPGAPVGIRRAVPFQLRLIVLPLIGHTLFRYMVANATREVNRKFWGQILVAHPERVDDLLLDLDIANAHRNVDCFLSLVRCVGRFPTGIRRRLILGERWQELRISTLFLWGERDAFGPPSGAQAIAARSPNLRLVRIPDAGHLPWIDDPEMVASEIEQFLRE